MMSRPLLCMLLLSAGCAKHIPETTRSGPVEVELLDASRMLRNVSVVLRIVNHGDRPIDLDGVDAALLQGSRRYMRVPNLGPGARVPPLRPRRLHTARSALLSRPSTPCRSSHSSGESASWKRTELLFAPDDDFEAWRGYVMSIRVE